MIVLCCVEHVLKVISANSQHDVENAIKTIRLIIKDAIENPEGQNDLRKTQLMELARLNGTLREGFEPKENSWLKPENQTVTNQLVCTKCGARGHIGSDCMSGHTGNSANRNSEMTKVTPRKREIRQPANGLRVRGAHGRIRRWQVKGPLGRAIGSKGSDTNTGLATGKCQQGMCFIE